MMTLVEFVGGLAFLVVGGEALVRGASGLARRLGISPLVIGLTVVAMGTSAPELVVSTLSTLEGKPDIAVGNVVGSNIFNVLFILGLCAAFRPLAVAAALLRRDVPLMIGASVLLLLFGIDGRIGPFEGVLFLIGLVAFVFTAVRQSRRESAEVREEFEQALGGRRKRLGAVADIALVGAGLGLLVLGARWLVNAAVVMAGALGVSEAVIGLTVVAAGTSLPEVATSFIATLRGQRDIAVGNVIGSNLFNILGILGTTAVLSGRGLPVSPGMERFDIPVMTAVAVACLPFLASGRILSRWEGWLFLGYYAAYTLYLALASTRHDGLDVLSAVMLWFALPLTGITIGVVSYRAWKERHAHPRG